MAQRGPPFTSWSNDPRESMGQILVRERLVTEASEHVLSFDWDEIAQRTQGVYSQLRELRPREEGVQGG